MKIANMVSRSLVAGLALLWMSTPLLAEDSLAVQQMAYPAAAEDWPAWTEDRRALMVAASAFAQGESVQGELLPGTRLMLVPTGLEHRSEGRFAWRGRILEGERTVGSATLSFHGTRVRGLIFLHGQEYRLSTDPRGHQWLDRLDPESLPPTHPEGAPYPMEEVADGEPKTLAPADDNAEDPVVDVLVFYSEGAIADYADEADLRLAIQNAADINNTAFINSQVEGRVRLLGVFPWDWQETGSGGDALSAIAQDADVQALQDLYSADLVAAITADSDVCGVAWLLTSYTDSWGGGYSMTSSTPQCLGGQTFAHELGHNMGLHHDQANAGSPGSLIEPFAYGYFEDWEFRTIMSYWNECPGESGWEQYSQGCPQIDHFSDPDINHPASGLPTGTADNNNAEVLRRVMPYVEQWYEAPSTLAVASGEPANQLETGGDSRWVAQDQYTWDDAATGLLSGPVFAGEESWLALSNLDPAGTGLLFRVQTTVADAAGELHVYADNTAIASFPDLSDAWVSHSVSVPENTDELRWVWRANNGADAEAVGMVAMAAIERDDLVESTFHGIVRNTQSQGVDAVSVQARDGDGNGMGTATETAADGGFALTVTHPEGAPPASFALSGEGVMESDHPLGSNGCEDETNPCSLTAQGVSRVISGQVSGMLAGESVIVGAGLGTESTATVNASGVADFSFSGDALVAYGPLSVEAAGYHLVSNEISSIDIRSGDASGLSVSLGTATPEIHTVDITESTKTAFTVEVSFDAFERAATAILTHGEGEDEVVQEQPVMASADGHLLSFELTGLDCGSTYNFNIEVVNDHGQHDLVADSADTADCSSSSGCSLGNGARMDPLFGLLLLLALGGVLRRRGRVSLFSGVRP